MKSLTIFVLASLTFLVEVIKCEESEFSGKWTTIATCRAKCLHKVCFIYLNYITNPCKFSETRKENSTFNDVVTQLLYVYYFSL